MRKIILSLCLLLALVGTAGAEYNNDLIRENPEYWDCVSYTISYCNDNQEFIPCSISYLPTFKKSHMVAVKVLDDETLLIHDGMFKAEYEVHNWQLDDQYYHFWIDEPVLRNWGIGRVKDNSNAMFI